MKPKPAHLPYNSTGYFSSLVTDYINGAENLRPFYAHPVSIEGIKTAIEKRKQFPQNRQALYKIFAATYEGKKTTAKQQQHLRLLLNDNTFTVCTAHQPNIFTGHLYFIYKILHAVALADQLNTQINGAHFVPVFYMGSEDADIDELSHVFLTGEKYVWPTSQKGAVGRMIVDKGLLDLIDIISGQLLVQPHGNELVQILKNCYVPGITIEQATFNLVNELFAGYGLLILLPDNHAVKNEFKAVMAKELLEQFSHPAVAKTIADFPAKYKLQATGRQLNLFYLNKDKRERIEKKGDTWKTVDGEKIFSEQEILEELQQHPEHFSPNVILRPLLQETILPNIAFIGGGGELSYWLQLKNVFDAAQVPFPVLLLRNSFLLADQKHEALMNKLGFSFAEVFQPAFEMMSLLVRRESSEKLHLEEEKKQLSDAYQKLKSLAGKTDKTLAAHTESLQAKALKKISELEKKMLRAEKKKFEAHQRQIIKLKAQWFPDANLQERVENFMPYYAAGGRNFIENIYLHSLTLQSEFTVLPVA